MLSMCTVGLPWTRSRIESAAATTAADVDWGSSMIRSSADTALCCTAFKRVENVHAALSYEIINFLFEPGLPP